MASDVKFAVKDAVGKQVLTPVTVSDELRDEFIKKSRSSSWKLLPVSLIVSAVVLTIVFLIVYYLGLFIVSTIGLLCVIFPFYAVYNLFIRSEDLKGTTSAPYSARRNTTPANGLS